ncbi:MAG: hypothetical protein WC789_01935 [Lentisphaeria bacterium]|jgi:hypothetical protein
MTGVVSNRRRVVAAAALVAALAAGPAAGIRADSARPAVAVSLQLPPLAEAVRDEAAAGGKPGGSWRQTGELPASFAAARADLDRCLRRQGWRPVRRIPVVAGGGGRGQREISVWERRSRRILVMVWEIGPGRSGFGWGVDS